MQMEIIQIKKLMRVLKKSAVFRINVLILKQIMSVLPLIVKHLN